MVNALLRITDREIINKCGLDAYFFLRYLKTLLVIFIPIAFVVIPILVPLNYIGGKGQDIVANKNTSNVTNAVTGLDTLAWSNVSPENTNRYWAHLVLAVGVVVWVCTVFFFELRVYIKVRQDYLTSAEHRLRASATTVLVSSIPKKWLSEDALRGLFDVFPGGIRNIWLNRDMAKLLEKIHLRDKIHLQLESAETDLVKMAKKKHAKKKAADEKKARREHRGRGPTKQERAQRQMDEDAEAKRRAEAGEGLTAGDHEEVPHTIDSAVEESREDQAEADRAEKRDRDQSKGFNIGILGDGLSKAGRGLRGGVGKAGHGIKTFGQGVDNTIETTNGFTALGSHQRQPDSDIRRVQILANDSDRPPTSRGMAQSSHSRSASGATLDSQYNKTNFEPAPGLGNTVRKVDNLDDMFLEGEAKFWQFWKPPGGGYASPVPQQSEDSEFPFQGKKGENRTFWQKLKSKLPFVGDGEYEELAEYPPFANPDYKEEREGGAEWEKWIKKSDRPTHRLPNFTWTPGFLPALPWINKKVDTIYWCRGELSRLNMEIEEDQKHPERYPLMASAFIQFNHQVAAHMACQSLIHHVPKHMAPRSIEISPKDVIWDNMAITWFQEWIRTAIVTAIVTAMIVLWAIPVAWTGALAQIDSLIARFEWLSFLQQNASVYRVVKIIAGVLPAVVLAILLFLVPVIFNFLAEFKGAKTGAQKAEFVQIVFFAFLFVQVFLVVAISSFVASSADDLVDNLSKLTDGKAVLDLLANNLPKSANYFFSYMILQAMSTSSGTLLQVGALAMWYIIARILDSTARSKWSRNTTLAKITWGSFFPIYTNFACIALIFSVVAPLISVFAIITFSLLWLAQRYSMLYVTRFENDTGGVLYPRAINQTFTGLYVMELCLAGLFFIVRDVNGATACTTQAVIMLIVLVLTALYQILLNISFSPLFRYLPITYEDEAVLRDEAFQKAQDRRLGLMTESDDEGQSHDRLTGGPSHASGEKEDDIELKRLDRRQKFNPITKVGTWAARGGKNLHKKTLGVATGNMKQAAQYRRNRRNKDLEAQRAIGEALFGGFHDEIEDLTPEERDTLVKRAFLHYALRSRRPTVWLPRDDVGISDDEIRRTTEYSDYIWISNAGTALDSKNRVVYGRAPPDFSEIDLIDL
jgi:calcium permeable stress-gated cation channel